jgi:hypothetical protein
MPVGTVGWRARRDRAIVRGGGTAAQDAINSAGGALTCQSDSHLQAGGRLAPFMTPPIAPRRPFVVDPGQPLTSDGHDAA